MNSPSLKTSLLTVSSAKIALYTTLHAQVTNHRAVLCDREKMLKEAQENLVRSGGDVIGTMKAQSNISENTAA